MTGVVEDGLIFTTSFVLAVNIILFVKLRRLLRLMRETKAALEGARVLWEMVVKEQLEKGLPKIKLDQDDPNRGVYH